MPPSRTTGYRTEDFRSNGRYKVIPHVVSEDQRGDAKDDDLGPEPEEPRLKPEDVATIHDLIREGPRVEWHWPGWIPNAVLTAVAARGGTGKTRFMGDIVRRIRLQLPWPDGEPMTLPPDSLVLWVMSDNHHDELVNLAHAFGIVDNIRI